MVVLIEGCKKLIGIHFSDWSPVTRNSYFDYYFDNLPLRILTKNPNRVYQKRMIHLQFEQIGTIEIDMLYQRYQISSCYSEWQDLNNLPEAVYKEWTISKTQETLTVLCNGVEVINLVYAEVTVEPCSATWSKNVTKIQFTDSDTASDLRKYQTLGM